MERRLTPRLRLRRAAGFPGSCDDASRDGGRSWQAGGLAGHAVRALALAPSDAGVLIAGALDGVFRSRDAGAAWERISPEGHEELRNFDSLAIDPQAPDVIYAGTFHLPWKTIDGGKHWEPIHAGMIDDSDVLSMIVDEKQPQRIYASACSGIYRTDTAETGTPVEFGTHYQGFAGKGTAFERTGRLRFVDFLDGTSNTILIVEAGSPVPWSKPQDIPFSTKKPLPALGVFADVIHAAFVDGSVHNLRTDFDPMEMRKAIIRNDGEVIDFDKLKLRAQMGPGGMQGSPAGMFGGPPGMKPGGPAGMAGVPAGMPGGPGGPPPNFDLNLLQADNAKLEQLLQRTAKDMDALRQEVNQVKEQYALRREQGEAKKLLAEREKLRQQLEAANVELKAMRDELQQLKRGLDKP